MFSSLKIKGFRSFRELEITDLRQVNLLVGRNNSGKTSVLEALSLLENPASMVEIARRRDEVERFSLDPGVERPNFQEEVNISYLFHDYAFQGSGFEIAGIGDVQHALKAQVDESAGFLSLQLDRQEAVQLDLSPQGGLPLWEEGSRAIPRRLRHPFPERVEGARVLLIEPQGYTSQELLSHWSRVALTSDEGLVLEASRLIDPSISRIAFIPRSEGFRSGTQKSGIWVLREGKPRLPLGNLGDGVWRLLMIVLSLVNAADGILLVDEIDTGLHHTVLEGMWRLVLKTASRLQVQVFATTHSSDCWKALARVLEGEGGGLDHQVGLQRLEAGRSKSVVFPGNRIRIAAENDIEVR